MDRLDTIAGYKQVLGEAKDPEALRQVERELCRRDLFFLLVYVLHRKDVNRDWLYARCREVEAAPNGFLDLWAREHYKSTIITFALTIRDVLVNPEITVGIFSYSRPIAKAFLRQIKFEFEANEKLRGLFPDIIWEKPDRDAPKWSEDDGIVVRRSGNPKESTVEAWGLVDAQPTSKHFALMVYDDVVTQDSVTTPDMIRKVTTAWETSRNLTTDGGASRHVGTRWHFADTYQEILRRSAAIERRYPVTVDGTVEGEPVLWTRERVREKRREMGPYSFGAQLLLDPTSDRTHGFRDDWLRFYEERGDFAGMNKYLLVDSASERKKSSDYTAMMVVGLASDNNYYILDMVRDRLSLRERGDCVFSLHRRWRVKGVGYEKYGLMADIEYLKERMANENYYFDVTELGGQGVAKNDRIRWMVPAFEGGRVRLPLVLFKTDFEGRVIDLVQAFVEEEYKPFPVGTHDDMFDCLSRIEDPSMLTSWPRPLETEDRYSRRREKRRGASAWAA